MQGHGSDPSGGGLPSERHPSTLRISDADRHRVAEVLREAAGDGFLDLEELEERLEATYAAKTAGDLMPITLDLPQVQDAVRAPARPKSTGPVLPADSHGVSFAVMSESRRRGLWEVTEQHTAVAVMGSVVLDLREARFAGREVVIDGYAIMGSVEVVVNAHTQVIVSGVGVMGDFSESRPKVTAELSADSPVVRVRGLALMGSVTVQRKDMPGTTPRRLGWSRP